MKNELNNFSFFKFFILIWILWSYRGVKCGKTEDETTTEPPKFLTRGGTFRAVIGETVVLPCQVENLGRYTLVWKRGNAVLSAGDMKVTVDPRIHLVDGSNLEIKKVRIHDGGDYICQMSTLTPEDQIYTLEILVPPSVKSEPMENHVTLTKGDTVTLQCRGSGNPVPIITWTRKNNVLPNGEHSVDGNTFIIPKADRHQVGTYVCTANNGVGTPVSTSIQVKVQYPPEIEVEKSWIHSGDHREAELSCVVHADPPASVKWFLESVLVDTTDRSLFEERGMRYSLIIRLVQASDFGNYSCMADNEFGRSTKYIQLSGIPNRPLILSDSVGLAHDSFNITWSVESFSILTEYRLVYRVEHINETHGVPGEWNEIVIPVIKDRLEIVNLTGNSVSETILPSSPDTYLPISPVYFKFYQIKNLRPDAAYTAMVSASNKYGISHKSERFTFRTSRKVAHSLESSLRHVSTDPEVDSLGIVGAISSGLTTIPLSMLKLAVFTNIPYTIAMNILNNIHSC